MKLIADDELAAAFAPELIAWGVQFTQREMATLQAALAICEQAGELLQTRSGEGENPWSWAEIHLRDGINETQRR